MSDRKFLTAYFSNTGNTEKVAKEINDVAGGDLFEIVPQQPYPKSYGACAIKASGEKIKDSRPAYKEKPENLADYTDILIGYPAWCFSCPKIILSFIENNDFSDKNVYLFNTSMGSGSVGTKEIAKSCNGKVHDSVDADKLNKENIKIWLNLDD